MSQEPNHDLSTSFTYEVITKNAKALLYCNRFDLDHLPEKDDSENDSNSNSDADNDNGSDSDNDNDSDDKKTASKKTTRRTRCKTQSSRPSKQTSCSSSKDRKTCKSEEKTSQKTDNKQDKENSGNSNRKKSSSNEVEKLTNKLNHMSLDDPTYPALYFHACQLSPFVQQVIPKPIIGIQPKSVPPLMTRSTQCNNASHMPQGPRFMASCQV